MTDLVFCGECGGQIRETARFCKECGAEQEQFLLPMTEAASPASEETTAVRHATPNGNTTSATADTTVVRESIEATRPSLPESEGQRTEPLREAVSPEIEPKPAAAEPKPAEPAPSQPEPEPAPVNDPQPGPVVTGPEASLFCEQCARKFSSDAQFCGGCGAPRRRPSTIPTREPAASTLPPAAPSPSGPRQRPPTFTFQESLPAPLRKAPAELLVICGLMGLAGGLLLTWSVLAIDDIVKLLGSASDAGAFAALSRAIAILALVLWVVVTLFGAACVYLGWRMLRADRVARGLSYVLLASIASSILLGDDHGRWLILAMLVCLAAVAVLALSPRVHDFFLAEGTPDHEQPTSIIVARTLVAVWSGCVLLVGASFLPLGDLGGKWVVVGVVLLGLGAGAWILNRQLATGAPTARMLVTVGAVIYGVSVLVLGNRDPGLLLPLTLAAGIVWNLWYPEDAKRHFEPGRVTVEHAFRG